MQGTMGRYSKQHNCKNTTRSGDVLQHPKVASKGPEGRSTCGSFAGLLKLLASSQLSQTPGSPFIAIAHPKKPAMTVVKRSTSITGWIGPESYAIRNPRAVVVHAEDARAAQGGLNKKSLILTTAKTAPCSSRLYAHVIKLHDLGPGLKARRTRHFLQTWSHFSTVGALADPAVMTSAMFFQLRFLIASIATIALLESLMSASIDFAPAAAAAAAAAAATAAKTLIFALLLPFMTTTTRRTTTHHGCTWRRSRWIHTLHCSGSWSTHCNH